MTLDTEVLVIGGGATGGGIALDLALRGVRVILAEMGDLATGTSGRYHGLLHSGGRYAVRDPESARECIDENRILRRIVPEAIEDTSGFFVLCPGDDEGYAEQFLTGCAAAGIPTQQISVAEARRREKLLNPALRMVIEVPDGTCDSWDLLHLLQRGAEETGRARFLTYHRVEAFHVSGGQITGARLTNLRTGEAVEVACAVAINAAGPWAAEIARLAGVSFGMKLSRGAMLAYNIRWVNTVINKLRKPGDGDIFVPVGTVSVIGTTSVTTTDPGDIRVEPWEVTRILDEAEAMTPGISRARILRAWGGVRPLYDPGESSEGRSAKRTFSVLDHAQSHGISGLISVLGGKLTTYRLMAERAADAACARLNVSARCVTAETVLPSHHPRLHALPDRLGALERGQTPGALVCECEIVTAPQIRSALEAGADGQNDVVTLNDLRRDLRLGMGPCQGGFCAYRAAAVRHEFLADTPAHTWALLGDFIERRVGGMKALLWGHNLRQALLSDHIYGRMVGLSAQPAAFPVPAFSAADAPQLLHVGHAPRVVVIGAGLAGLTAALAAQAHGAVVELAAIGQGGLSLWPGWIETGDVAGLAQRPHHPYALAGEALPAGLALLDALVGLQPAGRALTLLGRARPVGFAAGGSLGELRPGDRALVVGFSGWRDFYPRLLADALRADGIDARPVSLPMPDLGGNFDEWPLDFANELDSEAGFIRLRTLLREHIGDATHVLLPAVLGFEPATRARLAESLRCTLIEVPTLPPSVPGTRLFRRLRSAFLARGGRLTIGAKVSGYVRQGERITGVQAETAVHGRGRVLPADSVILATGGLYGGGWESDYTGRMWETSAGLPLADVPGILSWFERPLLAGEGQPVYAARLPTDDALRPLNADGLLFADNLFAAGHTLGGFSPVSDNCGEGVDVATAAFAARQAVLASARARAL